MPPRARPFSNAMLLLLCCVYDVLALAFGAVVLQRSPWRGLRRELPLLGMLAAVLVLPIGALTGAQGGFAAMRGVSHGVFCVLLPLLALRAFCLRRDCRWFACVLAACTITGEACYVWARRVEPFRLEVTEHRITSKRLTGLAKPIRIAVVADLQTDAITDYEIGVFDRLVAAEPDLVLYAGDYLQIGGEDFARELPKLQAQVRRLRPRLGSYAVDGDVDLRGAKEVFAGTDVQVLADASVALPGVPIDVHGMTRMRSRAPFVDAAGVRRLRGERYAILLGHAPDFMLAVVRDGLAADALMVAGHTHGGQIQLPWFGPLLTLSSVPRWLAAGGVFRRGDSWLVCSRGIGMERGHAPRIRFLCRPQIILLELAGE